MFRIKSQRATATVTGPLKVMRRAQVMVRRGVLSLRTADLVHDVYMGLELGRRTNGIEKSSTEDKLDDVHSVC